MRTIAVLFLSVFTVLSLAGPSLAEVAAGKGAKTRQLIGDVVSVNREAKSVIVKTAGRMPRDYTFAADKDATGALAELKPGERVRVTYTRAQKALTATAIVKTQQAAKR